MNDFKPIFNNEKLSFTREEKDGYFLISLKEFPELHEIIVNATAWKIFSLCNGNNTLEDIINVLCEYYENVEYNQIKADMADVLSRFTRLGLIEWEDENDPYIINNDVLYDSGYKIRLARERDYHILFKYLNNVDYNYFYKFVSYLDTDYKDITLRAKIFYRMEDFYILLNADDNIECVIGVMNSPSQIFRASNLTFISNSKDLSKCSFLLSFIKDTHNDRALQTISKIRAIIKNDNTNDSIIDMLKSLDFIKEVELKNEINYTESVIYYSFIY
ncbi:hypothetical protein CSA08_04810 [Candidatus Gracilibacteria bacterium]|nr:MAG: hypothetical protein CSA08_04810 [Candidatus Gracilibacteria bacterium]